MTSLSPKRISLETWLSSLNGTQVYRFKDVFEIEKRPNRAGSPQVLSLTNKGIIERDISNNEGQIAESYDNYQIVQVGDFVLNPMDLLSGWVARSPFAGVISNAYFVFRLRSGSSGSGSSASKSNPVFYERVLQSYYSNGILEPFGKGVGRPENGGGRWTLNSETLCTIPLPKFPSEKQDAIVNHLDGELSQIDKLIDKQSELSGLLQERRNKLITDTLIYGLDSNTSMTESKYEWLPNYPSHWTLSKISNLHKFKTGGTPASGNEDFYGGEYAWATIGDLGGKEVLTTKHTLTSAGVASASMSEVKKGSLLFSFKLSVGQVAIAGTDMYTNEAIAAFEPNPNIDLAWAYYAYAEFIPHFTSWNIYGARLMNQDLIRSARVPLPPLKEQREIADFLDSEVAKIDLLTTKATQIKEALLQRRMSLISAAVTGKIKLQETN